MMLKLLGQFYDVDSTEGEGTTSRHTGRLLRKVEIGFNCGDTMTEQLNAELNAARKETSALEGEDNTRWAVDSHSCSSTSSVSWRYTVALRQIEDLRAECLQFLGLALVPSHFEESADPDGPVVIIAEVAPTAEDSETLEHHIVEQKSRNQDEVPLYFDLRRIGVQDEPMRVRFGRCLWQNGEDGTRQHLLVFVSADGDDEDTRRGFVGFDEPRSTNTAFIALQGREIAEALIHELDLAGLLSREAVERIRKRGEKAWDERFRDLNKTDDLSRFH